MPKRADFQIHPSNLTGHITTKNMNENKVTIPKTIEKVTRQIEKSSGCAEECVGQRIRALRRERGLSLRALAQQSGLNINTLSMIENGKSSPCVSTLQQLATALQVQVVSFFETSPAQKRVVYHQGYQNNSVDFQDARLENLGGDLAGNAVQPFIVRLKPGSGSGKQSVVHTGHEFVYCLSGEVLYEIEETAYTLLPGDSIVFESHLPHRWHNHSHLEAKLLLVFFPSDQRDQPSERHFSHG